jgi:transcriptional regulator with XRE-family HTH domain
MLCNPNNSNFPSALLKARKSAGLTQEELALKAGIHKVMPGRYERGIHVPDMVNWTKLNRVLFPETKASDIAAVAKATSGPSVSEATIEELVQELQRRGFSKVSLASA